MKRSTDAGLRLAVFSCLVTGAPELRADHNPVNFRCAKARGFVAIRYRSASVFGIRGMMLF